MHVRSGVRGVMSIAGCVALAGSILSASSASAQVFFETVAKKGVQAPGLPAGVTYLLTNASNNVEQAYPICNGNAYAMVAPLQGTGVTVANDSSVYADLGSGLTLVAREGDSAAGLSGGIVFGSLTRASVAASNQVFFLGSLSGGGTGGSNNECLWSGTPGSLSIRARRGNQAAGLPAGVVLSDLTDTNLPVAPDGSFGFHATLSGTGVTSSNNEAFYVAGPTGSAQLLARRGEQAPGMPSGANFSNFIDPTSSTRLLQVTTNGRGLFAGGVLGGGTTITSDSGLWFGAPGQLQLVAREGDLDPGGTGTTMLGFSNAGCNTQGDVLYRVTLSGILVGSNVIYKWRGGTNELVIKRGDDAPGLAGLQFNDTMLANSFRMQINDQGSIALPGTVRIITGNGVDSSNNEALWLFTAEGSRLLVAREGDLAPGLPGLTLGSINGFLQQMMLGSNDHVVFVCNLSGAGVGTTNDNALYDWTPANGLRLIVREGVPMSPLDDGTTPTPDALFAPLWGGGGNGLNGALRSDGRVGFLASFTGLDGARTLFASAPGGGDPSCDSLDFNNDTLTPDSGDLDDFIAVLAGGPSACSTFPTPGCNDIDFNNDGFSPDSLDLDALLTRLSGGPCLQ
jgi:hypothetical protein